MRRVGIYVLAAGLFALFPVWQLRSAETPAQPPAPDFQEVYDLIRSHLAGVSEKDLNRTAVTALIAALGPKVTLEGGGNPPLELTGGPLVKTLNIYEGMVAYLRISRVEEGLVKALREAYQKAGTNKLNGLVLDLRYAGGNDYSEAADTVDLFLFKERALLDWGNGLARSKEKSDAINVPVAVLINAQTMRAAEALAAVLRETGVALLLGGQTAGQAMIAQEFPLKNGQRLRIATASIQVGEHTLLSTQGVKPDIQVEVSSSDERAYFADAYAELTRTNLLANGATGQLEITNRLRRARFNEAELVRERQEGFITEFDAGSAPSETEPDKLLIRDPALARAIDVLKGLAVVRGTRR
jgi:Peptidase family S41